jgi:hypothetical protein
MRRRQIIAALDNPPRRRAANSSQPRRDARPRAEIEQTACRALPRRAAGRRDYMALAFSYRCGYS